MWLMGILPIFLLHTVRLAAQWYTYETLNLSFEEKNTQTNNPASWEVWGVEGDLKIDTQTSFHGTSSLRIHTPDISYLQNEFNGFFYKQIPARLFLGTTITISGYIKTEDKGYGSLWLATYKNGSRLNFNASWKKERKELPGWTRYTTSIYIDPSVSQIRFGGRVYGTGTVWFDSLTVYCNGGTLAERLSEFRPDKGVADWLKKNSIVLQTTEPGKGDEDLKNLAPVLKNVRIVSLGECTHGSHEIYRMKHRLLEYLATNERFTVFAMEFNMPEADELNDYIQTGIGDVEKLVDKLLSWPFDTKEVLEMVKWMREFNQSGRGKIIFTGFDMQSSHAALLASKKIAQKVDSGLVYRIDDILHTKAVIDTLFKKNPDWDYIDLPQNIVDKCIRKIIRTRKYIISHQRALLATLPRAEFDRLVQYIDHSHQRFLLFKSGDWDTYGRVRDSCMARNVKWIADHNPGAKIVLWAHNGHVERERTSMGYFLNQFCGDSQLVIGFATNEGTYTANTDSGIHMGFPLTLPAIGSYEYYATMTGAPLLLTDIRNARVGDSASSWLAGPLDFRHIGAAVVNGESQFETVPLQERFDMILFIKKTTSSVLRRK